MAKGDHIYVKRFGYTHHGIECGDGEVIHYSGEPLNKGGARVRQTSLAVFAKGGDVKVKAYGKCLPAAQVIARAASRIGQASYDLFDNNCEHFAEWCKTGRHFSEQVSTTKKAVGGGVVAGGLGLAGRQVVARQGVVRGLGGAGAMSGLKSVGGTVGRGAAGGIGIIGMPSAIAGDLVMRKILEDDVHATPAERRSRKAGRVASTCASVAAPLATVGTVSAAGGVAGLSGAGILSGLSAVGGAVGGGIGAGILVTAVAPAAIVAGVSYGVYRFWRFVDS